MLIIVHSPPDSTVFSVLQNLLLVASAVVLVLLNGFFVAAEFGLVKLRQTRVSELEAGAGWRGRILGSVHRHMEAYLSACQLGITLASLGLGWIGEPAFAGLIETPAAYFGLDRDAEALHTVSFIVAFSVISFLHIVVGELAPKSMAIRSPEFVSLWTAAPLWAFYWLMYPFIWGLNSSANWILRITGLSQSGAHAEAAYSPEELRTILHLSRPAAKGADIEMNALLAHTLELPHLDASDLMRPHRELIALRSNQDYDEVRRIVREQRYSRYPLLDGDSNRILGILHVKDLLLEPPGADFQARLSALLREPLQVRADKPAVELLGMFMRGISHFAIVLNADLAMIGFLTLEDLLETVYGEINDEHELKRSQQVRRRLMQQKDGSWIASGDTPLFRLERLLAKPIEDSATIGTLTGLLMHRLERLPTAGDRVTFDDFTLEVVATRGPHVDRIRIRI